MGKIIVMMIIAISLPALLSRLRDVLVWVGVCVGGMSAAFLFALSEVDAQTSGEGPAFMGVVLLFGVFQIVLVFSLIGRLIAHYLVSKLNRSVVLRVSWALVLFAAFIMLIVFLSSLSNFRVAGLSAFAAYPLFWLGLALRLVSNKQYSSKPPGSPPSSPLMRSRILKSMLLISSVGMLIGLVVAVDTLLPPAQFGIREVLARTFQNGRVIYGIPYSGGGMGSCKIDPGEESAYPLGSKVLVSKTRVFGRCSLSTLPESWTPPRFH